MRITQKELEASMKPIRDVKAPLVFPEDIVVYCWLDWADEVDTNGNGIVWDYEADGEITKAKDRNTACAYTQKTPVGNKCFIKRGSRGGAFSPTQAIEDTQRHNKQAGTVRYRFIEVSKDVFDQYVAYLRTKNPSRLKAVQNAMN